MKKRIVFIAALLCGMCFTTASAQFKIGGKKINVGKVVQAGSDAAKAITLSDSDIAAMSKEYMQWMDTHNPLTAADSEYGKRLEKLTGHIKEVDGLKVNFGVYEVVDVNAFACGDGSVRICAVGDGDVDPLLHRQQRRHLSHGQRRCREYPDNHQSG